MTTAEQFYQTLNDYIRHFGKAPPAAFINAHVSTQSLQQKIEAMERAIANNVPIE